MLPKTVPLAHLLELETSLSPLTAFLTLLLSSSWVWGVLRWDGTLGIWVVVFTAPILHFRYVRSKMACVPRGVCMLGWVLGAVSPPSIATDPCLRCWL